MAIAAAYAAAPLCAVQHLEFNLADIVRLIVLEYRKIRSQVVSSRFEHFWLTELARHDQSIPCSF